MSFWLWVNVIAFSQNLCGYRCFLPHCLGFELLSYKCHKIEILWDLLTLDFRKNERKERFVRGVHCFYVTDTGEMGNALFAVGWDFAFADNFHSFEFCTSK